MVRSPNERSLSSHSELMQLHVEALFTHDADGDLVCVNEPRGAAAPRFFLGRTADGAVLRFRHDVDHDMRRELAATSEDDVLRERALDSPPNASRFEDILGRATPVQRTWAGPAFSFPQKLPTTVDTILVTDATIHVLHAHLHDWVPDVLQNPPLFALTVDGQAVAACCSVRRSSMAHEAGVETAAAFRGRGYAAQVVAAWARAVRDMGRVPLYSTSWQNEASRAVARKLALIHFGNDVHIT